MNHLRRVRSHDTASRLAVLRDLLVVLGIAVFFQGYIYLHYYMGAFGISLLASGIALQDVFIFAYRVFQNEPIKMSLLWGLVVVFWTLHGRLPEWLQKKPLHSSTLTALRIFMLIALPVAVITGFYAAFGIARDAAAADVSQDRLRVHENNAPRIQIVETTDGIVHSSKEFERWVAEINSAGTDRRVQIVGESADRIFLYVGMVPPTGANLGAPLPDDHVYAIEKSSVTIREAF